MPQVNQLTIKKRPLSNFDLLVVTEPRTDETTEREVAGFLSSTKLYIVIACIAALVLVAIVQASCTIYKMTRKSSTSSKVCKVFVFSPKKLQVGACLK